MTEPHLHDYSSQPIASLYPPRPMTREEIGRGLLWLVVALPAIWQIGLLMSAISGRVSYPYDLEWMEGGMLHHALRIHNGQGIYVPPSIDFIPYLYTPLYPSLLALFGGAFGITYTLGRVLSVLSLIGIAVVSVLHIGSARQHLARGPTWAGIVLGLGLFAAAYPVVEGWYDLVRADTMFLFMVTAAIAALPRWARSGHGIAGHGQVAAGAALLALAFFCKQTGIVYVAFGGAIVLVLSWRRVPIFIATAGAIGLGGVWLLERTTGGWFWTYTSKIHRAHDFNMDRFWKSFSNILWRCELPGSPRYPALGAAITSVVVVALIVVAVTAVRRRTVPRQVRPLVLWTLAYVVSTIVGAVGWATEFAHFNAYMPAFLHGALAAGAAVPAVYACVQLLASNHPKCEWISTSSALALALVLAVTCWIARWDTRRFVPTEADVAAGDRLIARIKSIDGEVWMPSHPWYLQLAGKTPHVHRMGIKDVTTRQTRVVEGLDAAISHHAFAALVLDERDLNLEVPVIGRYYRPVFKLPPNERPRLFTGARVVPDAIWMPAIPATPPKGARVVFDFEQSSWAGWLKSGPAWGPGPVIAPLPGQEMVLGATGTRFATSMHGGDAAIGRVTSPSFKLDAAKLTMRLGGGTDAKKLYVELWAPDTEVDPLGASRVVATASVLLPGGEALRDVTLDVSKFRGKEATLVLVDESTTGHLTIDDVWAWE